MCGYEECPTQQGGYGILLMWTSLYRVSQRHNSRRKDAGDKRLDAREYLACACVRLRRVNCYGGGVVKRGRSLSFSLVYVRRKSSWKLAKQRFEESKVLGNALTDEASSDNSFSVGLKPHTGGLRDANRRGRSGGYLSLEVEVPRLITSLEGQSHEIGSKGEKRCMMKRIESSSRKVLWNGRCSQRRLLLSRLQGERMLWKSMFCGWV